MLFRSHDDEGIVLKLARRDEGFRRAHEALDLKIRDHRLSEEERMRADIAEHEGMVEQYGLRIPVLRRCDSGSELNWPFDAEQVVAFLS